MENEIYLFKGTAPGSENVKAEEIVFEEEWDSGLRKRIVKGVTSPSIIPYYPEKSNGMAIMVIPGGAYKRQVLNLEGTDIAEWLNSFGVTAFVLKHRVPLDGHENSVDVPLQDAQRAMRLIRGNSDKFGINPDKIGVMGFSAGGHLTTVIGTCYDKKVYEPVDELDNISAKPDFIVPVYPCIGIKYWQEKSLKFPAKTPEFPELFIKYATDELVTADTPSAFILVADDDSTTPSEHAIGFYLALRKFSIPAELHIYKEGSHGFGMGKTRGLVQGWTKLCRDWLESL